MSGVTYLEVVQARYLALRGGGLTLSPLDADRIRAWRDRGVPLELALLALEHAHQERQRGGRAGRARPLSLRQVEAHVAALHEGYARRSGALPVPADGVANTVVTRGAPAPQMVRLLAQAVGPGAMAYAAALHALEGAAGLAPDEALREADDAQGLAYLRALSREEQRALGRIARAGAGPRGDVPRAAHRATLRTFLFEAARNHGGLRRPSDLS